MTDPMTARTSMMDDWTIRELVDRLALIDDAAAFDRAWIALGVAVLAAVRMPPPPKPLVRIGAYCEVLR